MNYLTTIGVKFGYAVATENGKVPTVFEWLESCKSIGGISLSQDAIDVTTLSSYIKEYADGLADTGGAWDTVYGVCDEAIEELEKMLTAAATAKKEGKEVWWDVWFPSLKKSFYIIATPGTKIALPEIGTGAAAEFPVSLTINKYIGLDDAVEPIKTTDATTGDETGA